MGHLMKQSSSRGHITIKILRPIGSNGGSLIIPNIVLESRADVIPDTRAEVNNLLVFESLSIRVNRVWGTFSNTTAWTCVKPSSGLGHVPGHLSGIVIITIFRSQRWTSDVKECPSVGSSASKSSYMKEG
jgi:hypothetical protein